MVVRGDMVAGGPAQGWGTGDLGSLTPSGRLTLAGRRDDLIIVGGENASPEAVEARLAALPGVRECAVVGVPSEEYGQSLAALIVRDHPDVTREALEREFRHLPRMLRPTRVVFVEELPRNALGKLVRRELRVDMDGGGGEGRGVGAGSPDGRG